MTDTTTVESVPLSDNFPPSGYDPLNPRDLVYDEVLQRRETGYDVDELVARANATDPEDREALLAIVDEMDLAPRAADWAYVEPDALDEIEASLDARPKNTAVNTTKVVDQIHAAWLGRIAGCNLGKPVELGRYWTVERIRDYLKLTDSYPLTDYFRVLEPMPEGFQFIPCWPETTRGNIDGSARDDDIDYPILGLHLLEQHGRNITPEIFGKAWTLLFPLEQVYTAERAAYINLTNGLTPPAAARYRNPYREWIGAQIRGDIFGYVLPGKPWEAAALSFQDASLSHVANGIYGEMWAAALVSAAFTASDAEDAIRTSLAVVPPKSRLAEAIRHVLSMHDDGLSWDAALEEIRRAYGHYSWVHTINNAAAVVAGLLWSDGDFTTAVGRTVMSGWDTDSNGATAGSVAGILAGTDGLPEHLIAPLNDSTRSALFGFDNSKISDLANRTVNLAINGLD